MKWRCGSDGPNDDRSGRTISSVDKKRKEKRVIMDRKYSLQCRILDAARVCRNYPTSLQRPVSQHGTTFECERSMPTVSRTVSRGQFTGVF